MRQLLFSVLLKNLLSTFLLFIKNP